MTDELERFIEERSKIPSGDAAWVKLLAKELALGVHNGLWERKIILCHPNGREVAIKSGGKFILDCFIRRRWANRTIAQLVETLTGHEYVLNLERKVYEIGSEAFHLVDEVEPYNIFISYKRSESSALALLVLARLKEHSLVPFVDMALEAGGNWHADLEERIKDCDYFIILLGKDTLSSDMTVKEIQWSLDYGRTIIPLWHSGFELNDEKWAEIDQAVKEVIQRSNAIIVQDESASGYNSAIVELLNRFGVTP